MPHGRSAPQKSKLGVGLAKKLTECACESVADRKASDNQARSLQSAGTHQKTEDDEQQQTFKRSFVKLTRMTRQRSTIRKDHAPGHVGRTAPQFAIYEIGDPAKEQSDGADCAGDVAKGKDGNPAHVAEQQDGEHAAYETAVK